MNRTHRRPSSSKTRNAPIHARIERLDARQMLHASITGLDDLRVDKNASAKTINLSYYVKDASVEGTVVDMVYNAGTVRVALLDKSQPAFTANFLKYADANRYDDTIVHRVYKSPGLEVVQGGGFKSDVPFSGTHVEEYAPVADNYALPNTRGTLSMAKGGPNSTTSEYFFNTADNTDSLSPAGQPASGGFTVFAKVVGGQSTVDKLAATQVYNAGDGTAFETLPLQNYSGNGAATKENFLVLQDVKRVPLVAGAAKITVVSDNPALVNPKLKGAKLTLNYGANRTGSAKITVTTTGVDGDTVSDSFVVKVSAPTTGTLSGTTFLDYNKNKRRDASETLLAGWRVYVDTDKDGKRDKTEPSVFTDKDGAWTFNNLRPGTYTVRVSMGPGYKNTMSTTLTLTVKAGETNGGKFGFRKG